MQDKWMDDADQVLQSRTKSGLPGPTRDRPCSSAAGAASSITLSIREWASLAVSAGDATMGGCAMKTVDETEFESVARAPFHMVVDRALLCPVFPRRLFCPLFGFPASFPCPLVSRRYWGSFQGSRNWASLICSYARLSPAAEIRTHSAAPVHLGHPNLWPARCAHTQAAPNPETSSPPPRLRQLLHLTPSILLFARFLCRLFLNSPASPAHNRSAFSPYLPLSASFAACKGGAKEAAVNSAITRYRVGSSQPAIRLLATPTCRRRAPALAEQPDTLPTSPFTRFTTTSRPLPSLSPADSTSELACLPVTVALEIDQRDYPATVHGFSPSSASLTPGQHSLLMLASWPNNTTL